MQVSLHVAETVKESAPKLEWNRSPAAAVCIGVAVPGRALPVGAGPLPWHLVTEPHRQQPPSKHRLADLTLIVRPPGKPKLVKVFTDAERVDAEAYALEHGGTVETLG